MGRVFVVSAPAWKIDKITKVLDKNQIFYSKAAVKEYLIVFNTDPSSLLKDISGVSVKEITGESYIDMLEDKVYYENIFSSIKEGDTVKITDGEYSNLSGIVEKKTGKTAIVLTTVWGIPYRVEVPLMCLKKISSPLSSK